MNGVCFRFGLYEFRPSTGELRKNGARMRLQDQSAAILAALLEDPGEVVTREALRARLWADGTFLDFEHGVNAAVKRLREALGDSADNPTFVETLPRHGYRFIAPVEQLQTSNGVSCAAAMEKPVRKKLWRRPATAWAALLLLGAIAGWGMLHAHRPPQLNSIVVLPFRELSAEPYERYVSDSMTEAITTELGKTKSLRVISRHSASGSQLTNKSLDEIAHQLQVGAVIEGSVLRENNRIRVDVQLIQTHPERHLWAESYERESNNLISAEREVSREVALKVEKTLLSLP